MPWDNSVPPNADRDLAEMLAIAARYGSVQNYDATQGPPDPSMNIPFADFNRAGMLAQPPQMGPMWQRDPQPMQYAAQNAPDPRLIEAIMRARMESDSRQARPMGAWQSPMYQRR
jgi:hypothetical protein